MPRLGAPPSSGQGSLCGFMSIVGDTVQQEVYSQSRVWSVGINSRYEVLRVGTLIIVIFYMMYVKLAWILHGSSCTMTSPVEMSRMPCYLRQGTNDFRNGCSVG